jgi:hypothetical protein
MSFNVSNNDQNYSQLDKLDKLDKKEEPIPKIDLAKKR